MANLLLLGYFKYLNFFFDNIAFITDGYQIEKIILPIGLSFYTFQQISYQADAYRNNTTKYSFLDYSLFVAFFPQLIAGPIVHHSEMLPQFIRSNFVTPRIRNLLLGLCVFAIGLFKKSVLADTFATYADPVFNGVLIEGTTLAALDAWQGVLAYGLQLYFDFSGYSDMAVGLGVMFGIKIPFNFFSPLKSQNMTEFWRRWHMSLTREVNNLVYNPISMNSMRYVANKRMKKVASFIVSVLLPTLLVWLIVGAWHGAGWTFLFLGLFYGICIAFNHFCRQFIYNKKSRTVTKLVNAAPPAIWISFTFIAYLFSAVLFRTENMKAVGIIYTAMLGFGSEVTSKSIPELTTIAYSWLLMGLFVLWALPNSMEYFARYNAGIDIFGWRPKGKFVNLAFRINIKHVVFCATLMMLGMIFIAKSTAEFIYFDF